MNTTTVKNTAEIIDAIDQMTSEEIMTLNNLFCESAHYYDDEFYYNDEETLQMLFSTDILRAIQATQYGNYNYHHEFMQFNGYGNLNSFERLTPDNLPDTLENVAQYIFDNQHDFVDIFDFE